MAERGSQGLGGYLDRLHARFDAAWLSPDPLEVVRRYSDPADQEVVGFYAAGLAYGRVDQILRSLDHLTERLGPRPARFVREFDFRRDADRFDDVRHRFHAGRDMALLTELLHRTLAEFGSIAACFTAGDDPGAPDIGPGLAAFCHRLAEASRLPAGPSVHRGRLTATAPVRHFFPSPAAGSACKRLNLYLRWMVRRADGLDLGLWDDVDPARLIIPLDTHVARISRYIGLSRRATPDWKMAVEITRHLAEFDPGDPVKYDFALCRLGILDYCPRRRDRDRCAACLLLPVCQL